MSSTTYEFGASGPVEPFWQRIHKFFTLPLDKAVLMRIGGLAAASVIAFALFFLGVARCRAGPRRALRACSSSAPATASRSSSARPRASCIPSDYPLSDDDLVSPYLPYKFVAMNIVFGLLLGLMTMITGGSEFFSLLFWFVLFVVVIPAATMRLVITGSLRAALNPAELVALVQRIGKPYAALAAFVFFADLCRTYGMAALAVAGGSVPAARRPRWTEDEPRVRRRGAALLHGGGLLVLHVRHLRADRLRHVPVRGQARHFGRRTRRAVAAQHRQPRGRSTSRRARATR